MKPIPGRRKAGTQVVVSPTNGRVIRYKVDWVGNDLTAHLAWCETHSEPVWVYEDGSYECPHDRIVGVYSDDHALVVAPWERPTQGDEHGGTP